ncbi:MAG: DUF433 domain-containing protein [Saprospiraceae bacterium]|nr:DUF433 domain-containing protein [Saprospiraceae bacterium]
MDYRFANFPRISVNPEVCTGRPYIVGTRITISSILAHLAGGISIETMLQEFPRLRKEDIYEALAFAASNMQEIYIPLQKAS